MAKFGKPWRKGNRYFVYWYETLGSKKYRVKYTAKQSDWRRI